MSQTPENRELRYQRAQNLVQQSVERAFFNMDLGGLGMYCQLNLEVIPQSLTVYILLIGLRIRLL